MTSNDTTWATDEAGDLAALVTMYAALDAEARSELLATAIRQIAAPRVLGLKDDEGEPLEVDAYIAELARGTLPLDGGGRLFSLARGVSLDAEEAMFTDGIGAVVLDSSDRLWSHAEGFYAGYVWISNSTNAYYGPDGPADVLGIEVSTSDFERWEDDAWVVDREAHAAEVRRRCIASCASTFAEWRRYFFHALLEHSRS